MRNRNAGNSWICSQLFTCNILCKTQVSGTGKSLANVLPVREAANFQTAQNTVHFLFAFL